MLSEYRIIHRFMNIWNWPMNMVCLSLMKLEWKRMPRSLYLKGKISPRCIANEYDKWFFVTGTIHVFFFGVQEMRVEKDSTLQK